LGLPESQVIPVSAQKGLVGKVTGDDALLQASRLPQLEDALGRGVMGQRQTILRAAVSGGIADLRAEAGRVIQIRRRDIAEQTMELRGLRGKNTAVIRHMRSRIEGERREFEDSGARIHAVRSVHLKLLRDLFNQLSSKRLKAEIATLSESLRQKGLKLGVKTVYDETFEHLATSLRQGQTTVAEIGSMLSATFRQLNTDFGFSLQVPPEPDLTRFETDLRQVQQSHNQYVGLTSALKLSQPEFSERLVRALATRLRGVFESASSEVEMWSKSATSQLDAQLRERRRTFARRIEAIDRIQEAASGLDERIAEIEQASEALNELDTRLLQLTAHLVAIPQEETQPALADKFAAFSGADASAPASAALPSPPQVKPKPAARAPRASKPAGSPAPVNVADAPARSALTEPLDIDLSAA
jgi:hypothetical protein